MHMYFYKCSSSFSFADITVLGGVPDVSVSTTCLSCLCDSANVTCIHVRSCVHVCVSVQHKQGEIKHVFRGNVFLTVRDQVENGGIIVCKAKHVELAGGTSHAVSYSMALNHLY